MLSDYQLSYPASLLQSLGTAIKWSCPCLSLMQGRDLGQSATEIDPNAEGERGRGESRVSHHASPAGTLQSRDNPTQVKGPRGCLHLGKSHLPPELQAALMLKLGSNSTLG